MTNAASPDPNWWERWRSALIVGLATLTVLVLMFVFRDIFAPLGVALALAYILNPFMRWGARHRIPRGLAAVLLFLGIIAVAALVLLFAVPPLVGEVYNFGVAALGEPDADTPQGYLDLNGNGRRDPGYLAEALVWAGGLAERMEQGKASSWYGPMLGALQQSADARKSILAGALDVLKAAGGALATVAMSVEHFIVQALLTAVYLFFFLVSFDGMIDAVRRRLPAAHRERIESVAAKIDAAVSAFLRGRLLVCLIVGVSTAVGLAIVGVPYWYLIGVVTGVAGLVPFLPIFVGLIPAVLVAWFDAQSAWSVVGVLTVFTLVQGADGWILTPFVQGKAVGLHPVSTMVALLLGWELLGLFGMIAAVPLAATLKILAEEYVLPEVEELAREKPDRS